LSTKLHAAVDGRGRLLRLTLTPGQKGDCPQAQTLLSGLEPGTVGYVIADAAYDSDDLRQCVRQLRAGCCIKPNPTRRRKKRYDRQRYKHRNVIERFFCRLRRCRRVATRYEKKAANFAGFVYLAAFITEED
jgi:putative transposase